VDTSDDDSVVRWYVMMSEPVSNYSSLQNEHFDRRTIFVGSRGAEISFSKEKKRSGRGQFKNEPLIAKRNRYGATGRMVTGMAH
jgi:hypothetical protein